MSKVRLLEYNSTEAHENRDVYDTKLLGAFNVENENTYLQMIKFAFEKEITIKVDDSFYWIDDYMLSMPVDNHGIYSIDVFLLRED